MYVNVNGASYTTMIAFRGELHGIVRSSRMPNLVIALATVLIAHTLHAANSSPELRLTPQNALEAHGLSIFLFHNAYHPVFGDQKMSGLEIIFHDRRIATNGDVRLSATPAQWDPIPRFKERKPGPLPNQVVASLSYADRAFDYQIAVQPENGGIRVSVLLDKPVPSALSGKAGFNLEFLPPAFFGKSYIVDNSPGMFPRHPGGPMIEAASGPAEPAALASGHSMVLSPEDPAMRVAINSELLPTVQNRFMFLGGAAIRAIPYMNSEFKAALRSMVVSYKKSLDENLAKNPYGVPIAMGIWGGSGQAAGFATQMYFLHRAFPEIVGPEYTLRGLDYVLGVHPCRMFLTCLASAHNRN